MCKKLKVRGYARAVVRGMARKSIHVQEHAKDCDIMVAMFEEFDKIGEYVDAQKKHLLYLTKNMAELERSRSRDDSMEAAGVIGFVDTELSKLGA